MEKSIFFNLHETLTYNAMFNFLISPRGVGKTFALKEYGIRDFIKNNNQFIYLRRYQSELNKCLPKGQNFFKSLINEHKFENYELKNNNKIFYIDNEICGQATALTNYQDLKSIELSDVHTIIFDEFIIENGRRKYLQNEVDCFLNLFDSIARLRNNVRVFFLGNNVSILNPYFLYFGIPINQKPRNKTI